MKYLRLSLMTAATATVIYSRYRNIRAFSNLVAGASAAAVEHEVSRLFRREIGKEMVLIALGLALWSSGSLKSRNI